MFLPDPGSEFLPSRNQIFSITGSRIRIQEFKYFNPKKWFLSSQKYDPGCSSRILIFYPSRIPDSEVKKGPVPTSLKGTGSRIRIRNTAIQSLLERKSARTVVRHTLVSSAVLDPLVALRYTFLISSMFRNREMNATK